MEKPKFKFQLVVGEPIALLKGKAIGNTGAVVSNQDYTCTSKIYKSHFTIPEELYGSEVCVVTYELVGQQEVYTRTITYSIFTQNDNKFDFIDGEQCVAIYFKHGTSRFDQDNFTFYTYNTHPVFSNLSKDTARESNEMYLRAKLSGNIKLKNGAFDKIASLGLNNTVVLNIYKYSAQANGYSIYFHSSRFTKLDCTFDYDKREVTPSLTINDQYTSVLEKIDKVFDLKKLPIVHDRLKYKITPMLQVYVEGSSTVTNIIGDTYFEQDVEFPELEAGQTAHDYLLNSAHFRKCNLFTEVVIREHTPGAIYNIGPEVSFGTEHNIYIALDRLEGTGPSDCAYKLVFSLADGSLSLVDKVTSAVYAKTNRTASTTIYDSHLVGASFFRISDNTNIGSVVDVFKYDVWQRFLFYANGLEDGYYNAAIQDYIYNIQADDFAYTGSVYNNVTRMGYTHVVPIQMNLDGSRKPGKLGLYKNPYLYYTDATTEQSVTIQVPVFNNPITKDVNRAIPVCYSQWYGISLWASYSAAQDVNREYEFALEQLGFDFINRDAYTVFNAIKAILTEISPKTVLLETQQCSEFFFGLFNPIGLQKLYPVITPVSNIQAGVYNEPAKKAEVSLRDLLGLLKDAMQCYWYIDEKNVMHIEHISWFDRSGTYGASVAQLDITNINDQYNKKVFDTGHSILEYKSDNVFNSFKLSTDPDTTDSFADLNIEVFDKSTRNTDDLEISLTDFKTNIDYLLATGDPDNRTDSFAFVLAELISATEEDTPIFTDKMYKIPIFEYSDASLVDDAGRPYIVRGSNLYASPRYLANYYMHHFAGSILSNPAYTVAQLGQYREQKIRIPIEQELALYRSIRTRFGPGVITSISTNLDSQYTDVTLLHKPGEYPWPYTQDLQGLTSLYDKRVDSTGNVYDGSYFYIDSQNLFYALPSSEVFDNRFSNLLFAHQTGLEFAATIFIDGTHEMAEGVYGVFCSEIPSSLPAGNYFVIAIEARGDVASRQQLYVHAGLVKLNDSFSTFIPSEHCISLLQNPNTDIPIKMRFSLSYPWVRYNLFIADQYLSGQVNYADIQMLNNGMALATRAENNYLLFKDFKVLGR